MFVTENVVCSACCTACH